MNEQEFPKAYTPKDSEDKWYKYWEENGFFGADNKSDKPSYCISIPPPNVTGVLHMGHALVDTLQDVLVRWKRMSGFEALWVPGTDHAGIATQTVVERHLIATLGKRRKDFSREEFLKHVWAWKEQSESQILGQLKKVGCSCDWSRLAFTMDEDRNRAVRTMFKKMFDSKLIYRGDYLVNWDPVTQTALADDEVEYEEKDSYLWYFRYPLEDKSGFITLATTRPETMLGDAAIAVSPKDDRYEDLVGKMVLQPLSKRLIPIIADNYVDPEFGTGAVKISPAHDPNDYQMALNHKLEMINVMTSDGKMNENGGEFAGMTFADEARKAVVEAMKDLNLLVKIEPHKHRVGISYRSKAVIEPFLSKQWFVRVSDFKGQLRNTVETKKVRLIPSNWENTYFHWIDNLRDWCISRQLWWGHRIPIWYRKDNPDDMICYDGEGLPPDVQKEPDAWEQDEDVLDTWFSSSLWPFSILGWPDKTADLKKFYPNSTLVTGHDILFFWVARMILMGEYALGEPPFPETFLHGLIYGKSYWRNNKDGSITYVSAKERLSFDLGQPVPADVHSKWEKMSKSKGNIIDPLEIIETYGTDAMRMGLCASATHARQIDLDRRRFEEFKNFINKIWNGARFVFMNIESLTPESFEQGLDLDALALEDRWILSLLNRTIADVEKQLTDYAFDRAAITAYDFFWKEFCAYYVELVKPVLFGKTGTPEQRETKQKILCIVLCNTLRLMHPMAPFITEELFQMLKKKFAGLKQTKSDPYTAETIAALLCPACIVSAYPKVVREQDINPEIEATFAFLDEVLRTVRNIRAEMQLPPGTATDLHIYSPAKEPQRTLVEKNLGIVQALVRTQTVTFSHEEQKLPFSASAIVGNLKLVIPLPQEFKEKEKLRLGKERDKFIAQSNGLRTQLGNTEFLEKAPAQLVEKLKNNLVQMEKELNETMQKLAEL
ncbi:MAG: valine--tRNA ligase [Candidatus Melainabacteria bacterium]|nr:valine--tRNA ligase [Candidatus Melainabacteria bacterium]